MRDFRAVGGGFLATVLLLLLAGAGLLVAATLRVRTLAEALLAAYLIGFGIVVTLFLFLSAFDAVTRLALIAGVLAVFASAASVWVIAEKPRLPPFPTGALSGLARRPPLAVLAAVAVIAFSYVFALAVGTPPNGWDPLNYHLARAAFWLQSGGAGYVEPTYDERLNLNPPNAEIGASFALGTTHEEVLVGLVQFFAAMACALGIFALARRVGATRAEGALGSLLFLTLPIVLLQASLAKNDLVLASFLVAAAVFVLGESRREIGLATLAVALALGTKVTGAYGLVILACIALAAYPRTLRPTRFVALGVGAVVGSYWYAVNAAETGKLLGDQTAQQSVTAPFHAPENLVTAFGMAVDALDLSGARGADIAFYALAALIVAIGLALRRGRREGHPGRSLLAGGLVASPLVMFVLSEHVGRPLLTRLYDAVGEPKGYIATGDQVISSPTTASDTASWFGPLGFLLVLGTAIAAVVLVRRKSAPRLVGVIALAPAAWFVLMAVTLTYNPWLGRFFTFPVALSAALWGRFLRASSLRWSAVALAVVTAGLVLVHYREKPSGLRLFNREAVTSVWELDRWQIQSQHDPAIGPMLRFFDEQVPEDASVALALSENDFGYPFFGPHLDRRVEAIPGGSSGRDVQTDWLVASAERAGEIDQGCWRVALESTGGSVFARTACAS